MLRPSRIGDGFREELNPSYILTVTFRFSPTFGSPPVNRAFTNSNAVTTLLDGPSHNSAVAGSIRSRQTSGSSGPPGHHTASVLRQAAFVFSGSRVMEARAVIDR